MNPLENSKKNATIKQIEVVIGMASIFPPFVNIIYMAEIPDPNIIPDFSAAGTNAMSLLATPVNPRIMENS